MLPLEFCIKQFALKGIDIFWKTLKLVESTLSGCHVAFGFSSIIFIIKDMTILLLHESVLAS